MTTTKRPAVRNRRTQIRVTSKTVAVRFHGVTIDGWPAVFAIAIIMIAKLIMVTLTLLWVLAKLTWTLLALISPPAARGFLRIAARSWVWLRDFHG